MDESRRRWLLQLAGRRGLQLDRHWVKEWIKARQERRGHYRKRLKYYWLGEGGLLQSGPFYSQDEALLYLANNLQPEGRHEYLERTVHQYD